MAQNTTPSAGKPAPGDRVRVEVARMGAQGKAVASLEGFTMLVPRGLPGEQTEVQIEHVHPRYALARPLAVAQPSPERIAPVCEDFDRCGGCDWLHVTYTRQLSFKREVLNDQLARIGKISPPAGWEITPSEQTLAYRDKLEFTVVRDGEGLAPGFHGLEGNAPVAITRCHLAPEEFSKLAIAAIKAFPPSLIIGPPMATGGKGAGRKKSNKSLPAVTRLTVQTTKTHHGLTGLVLTLHCNDVAVADALEAGAGPMLERLKADCPGISAVAISIRERTSRQSKTTLRMLLGEPTLIKVVDGTRYQTPLGAFFQVNLPQAESMAAKVREFLAAAHETMLAKKEKPLVLDLFCGVGLFSLPLAMDGFRLAGMELAGDAVRAARASAESRRLSDCEFEAGDLSRTGKLKGLIRRHGPPNAVLVNPPRAGLPAALTESLLEHGPPMLVYVSCDGGTFARDVARLAPRYELTALHGFDLFPQTHHLEVLGMFSLRPEPPASTQD